MVTGSIFLFSFFFQDDIIDDVGDFVAAAEILKERGAYKIYIMATHGLLSADAPRLIEESAIDEVRTPKSVVFSNMHLSFKSRYTCCICRISTRTEAKDLPRGEENAKWKELFEISRKCAPVAHLFFINTM